VSLLIIKTKDGDYLEADDRPWIDAFFIAAHARHNDPVGYARLTRKEAQDLRDKLDVFLGKK